MTYDSEQYVLTGNPTPQEIFDTVCRRLRDGAGRCADYMGCVYYLRQSARRCAIGCLLPEGDAEALHAEFENGDIEEIARECPRALRREWMIVNVDLMGALQHAHDGPLHWEGVGFNADGEKFLKRTAKHFNLTYTPPAEPKP